MYHIFGFLKQYASYCIAFDPSLPNLDAELIISKGREEFYEVEDEPVPKNSSEPHGQPMKMICFIDASHASNKVTYRSHTRIFICWIMCWWCGTRKSRALWSRVLLRLSLWRCEWLLNLLKVYITRYGCLMYILMALLLWCVTFNLSRRTLLFQPLRYQRSTTRSATTKLETFCVQHLPPRWRWPPSNFHRWTLSDHQLTTTNLTPCPQYLWGIVQPEFVWSKVCKIWGWACSFCIQLI